MCNTSKLILIVFVIKNRTIFWSQHTHDLPYLIFMQLRNQITFSKTSQHPHTFALYCRYSVIFQLKNKSRCWMIMPDYLQSSSNTPNKLNIKVFIHHPPTCFWCSCFSIDFPAVCENNKPFMLSQFFYMLMKFSMTHCRLCQRLPTKIIVEMHMPTF